MKYFKHIFFITTTIFLISSCQSKTSKKQEQSSTQRFTSDGIELTNGWMRPGSKGGNSAAYLHLFNGTNSVDTLVAVRSTVANKTQVHESYEENGMAGMRRVKKLAFAPDSSLKLQPGGLHIMLMNLNRDLAEGDSVSITLKFSNTGSREWTIPVKSSN